MKELMQRSDGPAIRDTAIWLGAMVVFEQGVPSNRLVAAGFGENQPLDPEDTPEARARNRRIELKLTER